MATERDDRETTEWREDAGRDGAFYVVYRTTSARVADTAGIRQAQTP